MRVYIMAGLAAHLMGTQIGPPSLGSIQFLTGTLAGNTFQITKATTTIGREPGNDIVVSDPSVSRQHAQITWSNGAWMISKLAQQNTMTVNQRKVQQSPINDRDTIGLGATTFLFQVHGSVSNPAYAPSLAPQQAFPGAPPGMPQQAFPGTLPRTPQPQRPPVGANFVPPPAPVYSPTFAAALPNPGQPVPAAQYKPAGAMDMSGSNVGTAPQGEPSLEISSNVHYERNVYPLNKQVINIGRHPGNDIVINEPVVSAYHAQIVREGDKLIFIHPHPQAQRTTNGILYQGRAIPGTEPFRKPLERGDILRIGDEHGTLGTLTYCDASAAAQDVLPEIRPIPLGAPVIRIGRYPDNTVVLNHPQVSSHHAQLEQVQGGYRILAMGSTNGVYVNAQRMHNQVLKPGDEIRIGPFKLTYTGTQLTQHDESNSVRSDALP